MIEISLPFLSALTGKKQTEIEELQKSDSFNPENLIKETFSDKVEKARKEGWDSSAAKVKGEILDDVEKQIASKLGVTKAKIDDMLDEHIAKKPGEIAITDDIIRGSELFKTTVKNLQDKVADEKAKASKEVAELKAKEIDRTLYAKVKNLAKENKWDIPEAKLDNQLALFILALKNDHTFDLSGDDIIVKTKDGKDVVDDLQNVMDFAGVASKRGEATFNILESDGREAPGNSGSSGKGVKVSPFKDVNDYFQRVEAETDPAKLADLKTQYEAQVKAGDF